MSLVYNKLDSGGVDGVLGTESKLQREDLSLVLTFPHNLYRKNPRQEVIRTEKIYPDRTTFSLDFGQLLP